MRISPHDDPSRSEPTTGDRAKRQEEEVVASPELTPEEQMERYEEALKEEDWGHQPC